MCRILRKNTITIAGDMKTKHTLSYSKLIENYSSGACTRIFLVLSKYRYICLRYFLQKLMLLNHLSTVTL